MRLDGIPDDIIVNHTHDVIIKVRLQVDDETTTNIKNIGLVLITAVTLGSIAKTLTSFAVRQGDNFLWKRL